MRIHRHGWLLIALCLLVVGLSTQAPARSSADQDLIQITGSLTYRPRIAISDQTMAVVEVRERGSDQLVVEHRMALRGKQVPIDFTLPVYRRYLKPTYTYTVRGGLIADGQVHWISEALPLPVEQAHVPLGEMVMTALIDAAHPAHIFQCGDTQVMFSIGDADMAFIRVGETRYVLRPAISASGARFESFGTPEYTEFWTKGNQAWFTQEGHRHPECAEVLPQPAAKTP